MEGKLLNIDENNKKIQRLGTSWIRFAMTIVDVIVLMLFWTAIIVVISYDKGYNEVYIRVGYIYVVYFYFAQNMIFSVIDIFRYFFLERKTIIVNGKNITIIRFGNVSKLKSNKDGVAEEELKKLKEVNYIIEYQNCKIIRENRNYLFFIGEKNQESVRFKIPKVYKDMDKIFKEVR